MLRGRNGFLLATLALCILTAASLCAAAETEGSPSVLRLRVTDAAGRTRILLPFGNGSVFGIRYIHSVARTPVTDWFAVSDGCLYLGRCGDRVGRRRRDVSCRERHDRFRVAHIGLARAAGAENVPGWCQ